MEAMAFEDRLRKRADSDPYNEMGQMMIERGKKSVFPKLYDFSGYLDIVCMCSMLPLSLSLSLSVHAFCLFCVPIDTKCTIDHPSENSSDQAMEAKVLCVGQQFPVDGIDSILDQIGEGDSSRGHQHQDHHQNLSPFL